MLPGLTRAEILRYSRHLPIPEVGLEGQRKLKGASALIIGTGGLGSPVALYLAAAGVGRIGLIDYDVVDSSNLQRQVIHGTAAIGKLKVESAKARLLDLNPDVTVDTYNELFTSANAMQIADQYDTLIDGTDNPTRYLTNDVSVFLGKPVIYGSIFRFDGQVSVFDARTGPCYRCLFPEPPPPGLVPSCAEGILVYLPLIILVSMIPISISGLGVREGAFVLFFGFIGVKPEAAAAISLSWFISASAGSLIGLIEYLKYKKEENVVQIQ